MMRSSYEHSIAVATRLIEWITSHDGCGPSAMSSDKEERYLRSWLNGRRRTSARSSDDELSSELDRMAIKAGYSGLFHRIRTNGKHLNVIGKFTSRDDRSAKIAEMVCEFCDERMAIPNLNSPDATEKVLGKWVGNMRSMFRHGIANKAGISVLSKNNKLWLVSGPSRRRARSKIKCQA